MDNILIPTSSKSPLVIEKYVSDQIFICRDYKTLTDLLVERLHQRKYVHDFCIDWTYCKTHPLIFDVLIHTEIPNTFDILIHYYENVFLKIFQKHFCLSKMKIMLSMCKDHSQGMHIHVLDVEMFLDDYVHLFNLMKYECEYISKDYHIKLNCRLIWCLVGCDEFRNENKVYVPVREYHYQVVGNYAICVGTQNSENEMAKNMMPIPQEDAKLIYYPTRIVRNYINVCAMFKSTVNNLDYFITKQNFLKEGECEPFCRDFLKHHAKSITSFSSSNEALGIWYNRERLSTCNELGMFQAIDNKLRQKCFHLKDDDSPLSTLLQSEYYLPVFYALCNLKMDSIRKLHDKIYDTFPVFHEFPNHVPEEATHLNFETIVYCASKTASSKNKIGFYYTFMEDGWDWILESTESTEDLKHHVLTIQKIFYPVVKCSKDLNMYSWHPSLDEWRCITDIDIIKTIKDICLHMEYFKGYDKLSLKLKTCLKSDQWIEKIVEQILNDNLNVVEGQEMKNETFNSEVYGFNVPQYYFFNNDKPIDY